MRVVFLIWMLAPVVWAIICSLLPLSALTQVPPDLNPAHITADNYIGALAEQRDLVPAFIHSAIIAFTTSGLALLIGSMAAYALARLSLPASGTLLLMILAAQMFPAIIIIIPMFLFLSSVNLIDTYVSLVLVYLTFVLPIVIWVLHSFFRSIPVELEKAASVDGASPWQVFREVVLPLSLPPLFAAGIFAFIEAWNEFFFAVILTRTQVKTAPVMIAEFSGQHQTLYGQMLAAAVLASIPVVVLAIVFRRSIVKGFIEGAVKA